MNRPIREEVVQQLVALGREFSEEAARLGERANYCCEYCGKNLIETPEAYKLWENDHIVPLSCGGPADLENLALACRQCNFNFKSDWDPRKGLGPNATRDQLIEAAIRYIGDRKQRMGERLSRIRSIVG